ncbi:hypothetical protein KKC94_01315 [Patescibacteria group bacterium]|nr:hypothetical protein [Patescibacteria group bacterium]
MKTKERILLDRTKDLEGRNELTLFLGTERGLDVLKGLIQENIGTLTAVCVQDTSGHGAEETEEIISRAKEIGAQVTLSSNLNPKNYADFLRDTNAVTALCVNWRRLFPNNAIYVPPRGIVVAHDSLLPHLRGFAPLNHSIRNDESETGVTLFFANERTDSGDIIGQKTTHIGPNEYVREIRDRVTQLTTELICKELPKVIEGKEIGTPQDETEATYGIRLTPEDGKIDFSRPRREILNLVRATSDPYPGAFAYIGPNKKQLIIWTASIPEDAPVVAGSIPGRFIESSPGRGVFICAGDGSILLETIQLEEKERTSADKLIRRYTTTLY